MLAEAAATCPVGDAGVTGDAQEALRPKVARKSTPAIVTHDEEALREAFAKLDTDGSGHLQEDQFAAVCTELGLGLDSVALSRIYHRVLGTHTDMDFEVFCKAVRKAPFFKNIASSYHSKSSFATPAGFDFGKDSAANYTHVLCKKDDTKTWSRQQHGA